MPQHWASSALTSQTQVATAAITIISAGEWQEVDFHWHYILYFFYSALFLHYWCFWSLNLRVSLAYRVTQTGTSHKVIQNTRRNHRSIKIRNNIFTCNIFLSKVVEREDDIWPLPEINTIDVHCACLKALLTQAPHSVLTWLSIIMPMLDTVNLWPMGLPTVT